MRKNLLKTLTTALFAACSIWQASAAPAGVVRSVFLETYNFDGGQSGALDNTYKNAKYPWYPDTLDYPTIFEDGTAGSVENYSALLRGTINPPVTGNYFFFISSDDQSELYISTDENPANKYLIANEPVWNGSRDWTGTARRNAAAPENRSATRFPGGIHMVAGQRYYIEAIMKEGGGGNDLGVAWQVPGAGGIEGPIPVLKSDGSWTNIFPPSVFVQSAAHHPNAANKASLTFSSQISATSANNPANYSISGGAGLTVTGAQLLQDQRSVALTLSGNLVSGTTYTITASNIKDATPEANPMRGNASASFTMKDSVVGGVREEIYRGNGGTTLANMTNSAKYLLNQPDEVKAVGSIDSHPPGDTGDHENNYGAKFVGYIIPPDSGNYQFQIYSDDSSAFKMSTSADPKGLTDIIRDDGCCATRVSSPVKLVAGQPYYFVAYFQEGGGGDYLHLTWKNNGGGAIGTTFTPIVGQYLAYSANPVKITTPPTNSTILEGQNAYFSVAASGDVYYNYQWVVNGTPVPGATSDVFALYNIAKGSGTYNVTVLVSNYVGNPYGFPSYGDSATATVTVSDDTTAPTLVKAVSLPGNIVRAYFSEAINPVGLENFSVRRPDNQDAIIQSVALDPNNAAVAVITVGETIDPSGVYTLNAFSIADAQPAHNPMTDASVEFTGAATDASFTGLVREIFLGNSGPNNFTTLANNPKYPFTPDIIEFKPTFEMPGTTNYPGADPVNGYENYGQRVRGFIIPSETANYQFKATADDSARLYLSPDANPANKQVIINAEGDCGACGGPVSSRFISLEAGKVYYIEALMQEGGGGDYLTVQWKNNRSITAFTTIGAANIANYFVNPDNIAINITGIPSLITTGDCSVVLYTPTVSVPDGFMRVNQWFSPAGVLLDGKTNTTLLTDSLVADPGSYDFVLRVSVFGKTVDVASHVDIVGGAVLPAVQSVRTDANLRKIFLGFSKPVLKEEAEFIPDNYILTDAANNEVQILSATWSNGTNVTLVTAPLNASSVYTLTVNPPNSTLETRIGDSCQNKLETTNVAVQTVTILAGQILFETYGNPGTAGGIGGNNVSDFVADPRYPNSPRDTRFISAINSRLGYPDDSHEAYGGRMSGFFTPLVTTNYIFYTKGDDGQRFRMNTNAVDSADVAGAVTLMDTGTACCEQYSAHGSPTLRLNAGQRYYFEALWKEGGGGDFQQIAFKFAGDPASADGLNPISCEYLSFLFDGATLATRPDAPKTLPTNSKLPIGALTDRGFRVHLVQVPTGINNDTATAESLLACNAGPNVAKLPRFVSQALNYNVGGDNGLIRGDIPFPGIPGRTGSTENMAMEALTYLELQPGIYSLNVNSDDGVRVSPATGVSDPNNSITLTEFSGGRGADDSNPQNLFTVIVKEAGLYPFRVVWEQGGGGGSVEFTSILGCSGGTKLVNDPAGIKAYVPATPLEVDTTAPTIVNCPSNRVVAITNGCATVVPDLLPEFLVGDCLSAVTTSQNPPAGTVVNGASSVVVTLTATDAANNTTTCQTTLSVVDAVPPVITACAANTTVAADANCNGIVPNLVPQVTATDNCGGAVTITQNPAAGATIPAGGTVVTLTATDAAGNFTTCTAKVTVAPSGPAPAVTIVQQGSNMKITWTSATPCWKLQATGSLSPTSWQTVEGKSPVTVPIDSGMKFFRLVTAPNP